MRNDHSASLISAHLIDRRVNWAEVGLVFASEMPRPAARTNEKIFLPRRTGGQRFGPLLYGLAAFFVVGLVLGASQADSQPGMVQFSQQGPKLVGTGVVGLAEQGWSVALSGDGNTAIVGGGGDNSSTGAAWVYTRSGTVWTQHGNKLVGNHTFRATGITAYLKNGGTLENAAAMANHASTRTTQLYDRRRDEVSLDEVERIAI